MPVSDQSVHGADTPITESFVAHGFLQWYAVQHVVQLKKLGVLDIHADRLDDGKFKTALLSYLETTRKPIKIVNGNDTFWINVEKCSRLHYCCKISDPPSSERVTEAYVSPTAMRDAQSGNHVAL